MGIVWGVLAASGWGIADFVARGTSIRLGAYRALLYAHAISLVLLTLLVLIIPGTRSVTLPILLLAVLLGGLNTLGSTLLYHALSVGQVAIVSPIGSSFAAITLVLSLLTGDRISLSKLVSLVLTLVGVIMAATPLPTQGASLGANSRGIGAALGAAVTLGLNFWGLKYVVPALGPWVPVLESRVVSLLMLPLLAAPLGQSLARPPRAVWPMLATVAVLDTGANVAYNLGLYSDVPGVVAVLGSLFSPITVLLAFVLLHERLSSRQWIGVGVLFVAVAAIGAAAG
ncbi:MAG: DMT family transporter [Herpetosiphonaceae bacterium]|nr:DMT family transporter [Herpetosiphonaceae bacterium]